MKKLAAIAALTLFALPVAAAEQCYGKVDVGDSVAQVVERCGEPVRRERKTVGAGGGVQVIRGLDTLQSQPVEPEVMEKWYFDASLEQATVVEIIDGRVSSVRRLVRDKHPPMEMD